MVNHLIRQSARSSGIRLWEIAHALHTTDSSLSRKLRFELLDAEREKILRIIEEIERSRKNEAT